MAKCSMTKELLRGDWQEKTIPEIAAELHVHQDSVRDCIKYIRRKYGFIIPYRRRQRGRKRGDHGTA